MVEGGQMIYELNVGMTCDGCSNAIKKILGKVEGITDIQCEWETKKVTCKGPDGLDIAEMLRKWVSILLINLNK